MNFHTMLILVMLFIIIIKYNMCTFILGIQFIKVSFKSDETWMLNVKATPYDMIFIQFFFAIGCIGLVCDKLVVYLSLGNLM